MFLFHEVDVFVSFIFISYTEILYRLIFPFDIYILFLVFFTVGLVWEWIGSSVTVLVGWIVFCMFFVCGCLYLVIRVAWEVWGFVIFVCIGLDVILW